MRIQTINLKDWCQHKKVHHEFKDANLIGLLGGNGSGKSNVLHAMQFAITGETSDKLEEYVRDGSEAARVELVMKVGASLVTVTRTVKKDGKATAALVTTEEGEEDECISGVNNVNGELETMLGIDRDLAKNNVFVEQKHLDDILFTTPAKRERAWQRMCGMADAEKIHRIIGNVMGDLPDDQDYTAQIYECKENIEGMEQAVEDGEKLLKELVGEDKYDLAKIVEQLAAMRTCADTRDRLEATRKSAEAAASQLDLAEARVAVAVEALQGDDPSGIEVLDQKIVTVEDLLRKIAEAKGVKGRLAKAEEAFGAHQQALADFPSLDVPTIEAELARIEAELTPLSGEASKLASDADMNKALLDVVQSANKELAECPLCGSAIENRDAVVEKVETKLAELANARTEVLSQVSEKSDVVTGGRAKLAEHVRGLESVKSKLALVEDELASANSAMQYYNVDDYDEKHLSGVLTQLKDERKALQDKRHELTSAQAVVVSRREACEGLATLVSSQEEAAKAYPDTMDLRGEIEKMQTVHAQAALRRETIEARKSEIETNRKNLVAWEKSKADLERKAGAGTAHTRIKSSLDRVRKWFHYSQGPHKLSMAVLHELTAGVNEFLGTLDGRFYVEPDPENLMFNLVFVDGREQPETPRSATRGSGGEKSSLATSFRLASYYMFAGQLGLLCLDEPTEYLDKRKIESFGRVIEQLKEIGNQLDLQIFMATHRQSFQSLFDDYMDFGDSGDAANA